MEKNELTLEATIANIDVVTDFINEKLDEMDCPMKAQLQIDVAIDELFGNIAHYAYEPEVGIATICIEKLDAPSGVTITFIDGGKPYNPLQKDDPDVTLLVDERKVGGLGIYMVKKTMDGMEYEYRDQKNILKITKHF